MKDGGGGYIDSDIFSIIVKYLDIVPRETATK